MTGQPTQRLEPLGDQPPCPKCRNMMIRAQAHGYVALYPINRSLGNLFSGTHCLALVCTECGYTEFYAKNPKSLLA
jgi:predicted nucleic-acid-binding Zn-ribbon protein